MATSRSAVSTLLVSMAPTAPLAPPWASASASDTTMRRLLSSPRSRSSSGPTASLRGCPSQARSTDSTPAPSSPLQLSASSAERNL